MLLRCRRKTPGDALGWQVAYGQGAEDASLAEAGLAGTCTCGIGRDREAEAEGRGRGWVASLSPPLWVASAHPPPPLPGLGGESGAG